MSPWPPARKASRPFSEAEPLTQIRHSAASAAPSSSRSMKCEVRLRALVGRLGQGDLAVLVRVLPGQDLRERRHA